MKKTPWFNSPYVKQNELTEACRNAYNKSLTSKHAVKVFSGSYFYRGYELTKDGGSECPWNYNRPEDNDFNREYAETKKQAMENIDSILDNQ